jgi:hypothetical protein
MKFSIRALLVGTAAIAAALGTHLAFWNPAHANYLLFLGWYLIAVSLLTVLSVSNFIGLRGEFRATTIFGWIYFVCVLKGGFGIQYLSQAQEFVTTTKMGLALMGVCFLIATTGCMLAKKKATPEGA